jgi:hypothetical protein
VHAEGSVTGLITTTVEADGLNARSLAPVPVHVTGIPSTVSLAVDAQTTFVQGVPRQVPAIVTNTGSTTATDLEVTVGLPENVFWEGVASDSGWTCDAVSGWVDSVTCARPSLAAGDTVELAPSIRANTTQAGQAITFTVAVDGDVVATETTGVVIGTLPACEPTWQLGQYYRIGDRVSYGSWNYTRLINATAVYEPSRIAFAWRSDGACTAG